MSNKEIQDFLSKNIPEWSDEERMQTLFTAFREIKDDNYDTLFIESNNDKLFFWKNVIYLAQQEKILNQKNNVLTFPGKNLDQFFSRNGLTPSCIGSVINELQKKGELIEFNSYTNPAGWKLNLIKLVFSPITWGFSKLVGRNNDTTELKDVSYVNISILKDICEKILSLHYNLNFYKIDNLITKSDFINKYKSINLKNKDLNLSEKDIDLILIYLKRNNNINLINHEDITMLKFKEKNDKNNNIEFSSSDINVLKLKNSIEIIMKQVEQDESKKDCIQEKVKECIKNQQKVKALYLLKEKKMVQQFIEKKMSSYNTLQNILLKIQSCESDNDILNAMKLGSDTLKQYIEEKDLSVDRIDDVFSYIEDTLMDFDEIESTIKQNQSVSNVNDVEFEEEFNKLLKEETEKIDKPGEIKNKISTEETKINSSNMSLDPISNENEKDDKSNDILEEKMSVLAI
ncbi:hypothetical protein BCR32DRAFT_290069 [Anaeromyces robustus]|uniref:Charged multivesicular body protein 7 n=1 Tax=Anaeromyces robustus TaxID=1754192 RepID=A0A1Y1XKW2_9FUNG|nr:hypothetical protein BCR32DRAFT_290069 [Anaeromyces robustus]|eukprot:ORX86342.1 hypothetical protein BCR32DRAFT_290069 [Anaeromyces robustus]